MEKIVQVKGLSKFSKSGRPILNEVSFTLKKGDSLAIKGPSGCGKSTLAKILLGLTSYDKGQIQLFETTLEDWLKKRPVEFRQKVQLVFQHPYSAFQPNFPVLSYFEDAWRSYHGKISKEFDVQVAALFSSISFTPDILHSFPNKLSGGELQRIAILRALLLKPELIICDEITSNLDTINQVAIINLLQSLKKNLNMTFIIISHDTNLLPDITDKVLKLA